MSITYGDVQARIADELNRSDLGPQIQKAVIRSIKHFERMPFWFNETSTTLSSVAAQSYVAVPSDFLAIQYFEVTYSGHNTKMIPQTLEYIRRYNASNFNNIPLNYCYQQDRFELAPIPNAVYSMPLRYVKRLTELSATTDSNAWLTEAEDVIVYHSMKTLYATVIRSGNDAAIMQGLEGEAVRSLNRGELIRLRGTTIATEF
jgi:hypothetical protein